MTSDETLVAQVAADLLVLNATAAAFGQIALETDLATLTLPAIVVQARFTNEEAGSTLPKTYTLGVELRGIPLQLTGAALEAVMQAITATLCPPLTGAFPVLPASLTDNFAWFRIEKETGSEYTTGDTISRKLEFEIFALVS